MNPISLLILVIVSLALANPLKHKYVLRDGALTVTEYEATVTVPAQHYTHTPDPQKLWWPVNHWSDWHGPASFSCDESSSTASNTGTSTTTAPTSSMVSSGFPPVSTLPLPSESPSSSLSSALTATASSASTSSSESSFSSSSSLVTTTTTTVVIAKTSSSSILSSETLPASSSAVSATSKEESSSSTSTTSKPGSTATQFLSSYAVQILEQHNVHRMNSSVANLTWSDQMAELAQEIANTCVYEHVANLHGISYGQNIGAGSTPENVPALITNLMYNDEIELYHYYGEEPPENDSTEYGHYTQIVWKGTYEVGCATKKCDRLENTASDILPYYTVCNYSQRAMYILITQTMF